MRTRHGRWLAADARDVAIIGVSRPRRRAPVGSIAGGIARWQAAIERRRWLAVARRTAIAGLLSACLLQLGAVAGGRSGAGAWLLPAVLIGVLCLIPGLRHRTTPSIAARMLDRDLALGARVTTALELERESGTPTGLRRLAIDDGRSALTRSLAGAQARLRPGHRESGLLAALALALVGCLLLPAPGRGTQASNAAGTRVGSRAAAGTAADDPTRQHAGPDLRTFGTTQPTLPPLQASAGQARRTGAAGANGRAAHTPGSVQPASRTAGNAGYLQTARTNSSKAAGSASEATAGRGGSTLTSQDAPAAREVGGSGAPGVTQSPDTSEKSGSTSQNGLPGKADVPGGGTTRGGGSSARAASPGASSPGGTAGGATAGAAGGGANAANGVVPQLRAGKALPIQPGYEAVKGTKDGTGENASADANGAGGASHSGQAGAGAAGGSAAGSVLYVPPGSSTVAPADRRLLRGYFGSFARVSAAGW